MKPRVRPASRRPRQGELRSTVTAHAWRGGGFKRDGHAAVSWLKRSGLAAAVVVVVVVALVASLSRSDVPEFVAQGDPLALPLGGQFPRLSLEGFEGIVVGQRGRPVVVNVWASWCAPCRTEMPLLQEAAASYAGQAVILGVASNDDPAGAERFLKDLGVTYPNVFDASGEIRAGLGLTAYPTTYVFSANGRLRSRVAGGLSEQRLAALIEDALR